ncbi:TPA: hypothetical protein DCZ39_05195 [Patescibacteria group bacterium]|nr:hypothetical protein [Candidatus Gracilibacteria bacterium]
MPGENLKQIDKNKDVIITGQEIKDFFDGKNKDFLPDPKNLQDLAKEMDTNIKEKKMGYYIDEKTLLQAYTEITKKIAQNNELTQGDMKLLKLWMYIKEGKTDISFVDIKEYKENTAIFSKIKEINPYYKKTIEMPSAFIEKSDSVEMSQNMPVLNQTLTETQNMMMDFLANMKVTMISASDYKLYNSIIKDVSKFLQKNTLRFCSRYEDYQKQMNVMADFFNTTIHSNGGLSSGDKNPAYDYFYKNANYISGSDAVGCEAFIKFGNVLKSL